MTVKEILGDYSKWMPSQDYDTETPVVSVLLPTFRRAKSGLFEAAVQSVLNQDFKKLELIIIDDASTDGTADLIAYFMKMDSRVSCIRHERNVGLPAISEYEGYMRARGEYIAFIFDDNEWERDYISRTINFMVRNNAKATYGIVRSYYGAGTQYLELGRSNNGLGIHILCSTNYIANGGVVLNREVIEKVGLYDPHISQTRVCDWNLWKRIIKEYEFFETEILAGAEKGVTLQDSLGNSYKMNTWAAVERETVSDNSMLLPENFLNAEINEAYNENTEHFLGILNSQYENFSSKKWYRQDKKTVNDSQKRGKHILVLTASFDASLNLSFSRLIGKDKSITIKVATNSVPIYEIVQADAVVLIRNLAVLDRFRVTCKKLGIPCFYYADDNFSILAKENKSDSTIQTLASYWTPSILSEFNGILVSTEALKAFMKKRHLNQNIVVMEPVLNTARNEWNSQKSEQTTFAYMGGMFRDKMFLNVVMPALRDLAAKGPIRVLCPDRLNLDKYKKLDNIDIVQIPYSMSLELTLQRYGKYMPNFLLHCGPEIENNIYKTENAMMNAVSLGAVFVASKSKQYELSEKEERCFCVENEIEAWYEALSSRLNDTSKNNRIYQNAKRYCEERYAPEHAMKILKKNCCGKDGTNLAEMVERYNAVLFDMQYNGSALLNGGETPTVGPISRSLIQVPLIYSGGIKEKRTYKVVPKVSSISALGICFASLGNPRGQVRVTILQKKSPLRECTISFDEYVRDNWTYLEFDPIERIQGKTLSVQLDFEYENGSDLVGVFEDGTKRSLLYRVSNKLGCPLPIKDLLYVDFR